MDEEAAFAPYTPPIQGDPQTPPKLMVPPMSQAGLFPLMTLESFQVFTNYWYAQAQIEAQAGQDQYHMPHMTTFVQPPIQHVGKLSQLVNKAKQLGCDTFFSTVDAIATKNWSQTH